THQTKAKLPEPAAPRILRITVQIMIHSVLPFSFLILLQPSFIEKPFRGISAKGFVILILLYSGCFRLRRSP
ncbi:hypothetical protein, partial [Galactobacillus timonensis]|uniref:hypothetical protein n=1 Tax=Galactobacillus timonensis TaxID=2041840 RepID=UPI0023F05B79